MKAAEAEGEEQEIPWVSALPGGEINPSSLEVGGQTSVPVAYIRSGHEFSNCSEGFVEIHEPILLVISAQIKPGS